eukprot:1501484-Prymnesium_polylepis.1
MRATSKGRPRLKLRKVWTQAAEGLDSSCGRFGLKVRKVWRFTSGKQESGRGCGRGIWARLRARLERGCGRGSPLGEEGALGDGALEESAVSYTHLTLPTICSV